MATTTKPLIPLQPIYQEMNKLMGQQTGKDYITNDTLNWVDFGSDYDGLMSSTQQAVTSGLITLVTEQLTIHKPYRGNGIDLIRSRSGFAPHGGGIVQKNRLLLPNAVDDSDVYNPAPNSSSDPYKAIPINTETEYFDTPFQFRYEWTRPEKWMVGAFTSEANFISFINGVEAMVDNALALNIESLTMSAIRASMALNLNGGTSARAYNLLTEFNTRYAPVTPLTAAGCMQAPDFLRYATHRMFVVMDYMKSYTVFFNEKEYPQFSDWEDMHFIMLSEFKRASEQFLLSDTFNEEYLKLPKHDTVASWKGFELTGGNAIPEFEATSTINDTINVSWETDPIEIDQSGVLGTIFSGERAGIYNLSFTNTSQYDPVGLRTNYWTHVSGRSIVDPYENAVTFYVADPVTP